MPSLPTLVVLPLRFEDHPSPADAEAVGLPAALARTSAVIAVDGGIRALRSVGCVPDLLVGDLDSADPDDVAWAERGGARVQRHDPDKDATDLVLGLRVARDRATQVEVVGSTGGRADHHVANVLALTAEEFAGIELTAWLDGSRFAVVRPGQPRRVLAPVGATISLLAPLGATDVTADGLRWPLTGARLPAGTTLGVSNEVTSTDATVTCGGGVLLLVEPVD